MKRKLFFISAIVTILSTLAAGSLAYYTDSARAHNIFTTGNVSIALREWGDYDETTPFTDVSGVLPGKSEVKVVRVENTGSADAWVRVRVTTAIGNADSAEINPELIELDWNSASWSLGADGFWYYQKSLAPGEQTDYLFRTVTFSTKIGNEYQSTTATVDVEAHAVQVLENGAKVSDAVGWPAGKEA